MNNNNELIKQYSSKYPAFGSYMECMSRALMTGLVGFSFGGGGTYFAQHLLRKHLPWGVNGFIPLSCLVGVAASYRITTVRTRSCQDAWMAGEDKHTFLNPISERMTQSNSEK